MDLDEKGIELELPNEDGFTEKIKLSIEALLGRYC